MEIIEVTKFNRIIEVIRNEKNEIEHLPVIYNMVISYLEEYGTTVNYYKIKDELEILIMSL